MASVSSETASTVVPGQTSKIGPGDSPPSRVSWFDRSSITADAMVTIEGVSEEDWWKYASENQICEFFDGVVYMPSPAADDHQDEISFWFDILNGFRLATKAAIKVRMGPAVLKLAPGRLPEPDLFAINHPPIAEGPPALVVVEVLSKSTRSHDLGRKASAYRERGIPEIVYVDLAHPRLIVHRRVEDLYSVEILERGTWSSSAIPGFWLDVAWLWNVDATDPRECLEQILAGPPA